MQLNNWINGYAWAHWMLVSGQMDAREIDLRTGGQLNRHEYENQFDAGAKCALHDLIEAGEIQDNTI